MSPTIADCLEHARQCEWYAAHTDDEEDRKFLLRRAKHWNRAEIEKAFGGRLSWERLEGKRACRIKFAQEGGYRSPEDQWPKMQDDIIAAMNRLEQALRPFLKQLKLNP